jgi:hypothetical protein
MLDFNDFEPVGDSQNQDQSQPQVNQPVMNQLDNMFNNMGEQKIDEEEQKRISDRQKEAEERREKINKKMQKEEEARMEIRKKAAQYLLEFEEKRQEQIAKKRKELEEKELNQNQQNNTNGTSDSWSKVSGNIDLKDSEYKGSKDVQRMREAMLNKQNAPNTEQLQNFFG